MPFVITELAYLLAFLVRANTGPATINTVMLLFSMWTDAAASTSPTLAPLFQVYTQPVALALNAKMTLLTV